MFIYLINKSEFSGNTSTCIPARIQQLKTAIEQHWFHVSLNLAGSTIMKKTTTNPSQSPDLPPADFVELSKLSEITERLVSARLRNPDRPDPVSHVFAIVPGIDTESLLCHACETLASLNVMTTDLACELEGSRRNVALAIQQLAVLGELLVNRALDNLDPP
jgi:hypothetical protein